VIAGVVITPKACSDVRWCTCVVVSAVSATNPCSTRRARMRAHRRAPYSRRDHLDDAFRRRSMFRSWSSPVGAGSPLGAHLAPLMTRFGPGHGHGPVARARPDRSLTASSRTCGGLARRPLRCRSYRDTQLRAAQRSADDAVLQTHPRRGRRRSDLTRPYRTDRVDPRSNDIGSARCPVPRMPEVGQRAVMIFDGAAPVEPGTISSSVITAPAPSVPRRGGFAHGHRSRCTARRVGCSDRGEPRHVTPPVRLVAISNRCRYFALQRSCSRCR